MKHGRDLKRTDPDEFARRKAAWDQAKVTSRAGSHRPHSTAVPVPRGMHAGGASRNPLASAGAAPQATAGRVNPLTPGVRASGAAQAPLKRTPVPAGDGLKRGAPPSNGVARTHTAAAAAQRSTVPLKRDGAAAAAAARPADGTARAGAAGRMSTGGTASLKRARPSQHPSPPRDERRAHAAPRDLRDGPPRDLRDGPSRDLRDGWHAQGDAGQLRRPEVSALKRNRSETAAAPPLRKPPLPRGRSAGGRVEAGESEPAAPRPPPAPPPEPEPQPANPSPPESKPQPRTAKPVPTEPEPPTAAPPEPQTAKPVPPEPKADPPTAAPPEPQAAAEEQPAANGAAAAVLAGRSPSPGAAVEATRSSERGTASAEIEGAGEGGKARGKKATEAASEWVPLDGCDVSDLSPVQLAFLKKVCCPYSSNCFSDMF